MNGTMQQHSPLAYIVVCCQAVLAITCVTAICLAMFYKTYADPAILSAVILLTGTLVGNLGSILGGPRMQPPKTETEIVNTPANPVPTAPQQPTERPFV